MSKYNTYHSQVKICYSLELEKELLTKAFTKDIPRSTYFQWRQTPSDKYLGSEFAHKIDGDLENIKLDTTSEAFGLRFYLQRYSQRYIVKCAS